MSPSDLLKNFLKRVNRISVYFHRNAITQNNNCCVYADVHVHMCVCVGMHVSMIMSLHPRYLFSLKSYQEDILVDSIMMLCCGN